MPEEIENLRTEIAAIKQRNNRVEADKAWEGSTIRIGLIMLITYIIAALVMRTIGVQNYFFSALIPVIGYLLSTQSLPFIKRWWMKAYYKNR
jgi:hypothetical protein